MSSGVYRIKNTATGHVYIGQSIDLRKRIRRHRQMLRDNTHDNDYLQKHYNKYGVECFVFDVIEPCNIDALDELEIYWIEYYGSLLRNKGYNLESGGNTQKHLSEESKDKKRGENNPMYGKKWSEKQRINITLANRANSKLLTPQDVADIKHQLINGAERRGISEKYSIDITTVSKIVKCKNWTWVCPELNEALILLWKTSTRVKLDKAIELRLLGWYIKDIAKELHITSKDITRAMRERGNQDAV